MAIPADVMRGGCSLRHQKSLDLLPGDPATIAIDSGVFRSLITGNRDEAIPLLHAFEVISWRSRVPIPPTAGESSSS
jgi:hypothetical protein